MYTLLTGLDQVRHVLWVVNLTGIVKADVPMFIFVIDDQELLATFLEWADLRVGGE